MSGAPGETDLRKMLSSLDVERRPGSFTFVEVDEATAEQLAVAHAMIVEDESTTLVLDVAEARRLGLPVVVDMAWLSLTVQSSLEAVGLTAAFSVALGEQGISCNVLAGFRHDHLLVPSDRADDAIEALIGLR
ncbi:ACT domain-containing protein [Ilumatobacter coccineus]|jgi:uncharacterized protein|uniref:Uncharacterized protein n=1 Tax=Ilumatobacter coccineus (strain NBRC 103263 / KCTC 29153 / YM16-304) TaxID=1313172 RepID=A0A6C7E6I4_ILUCY|nr:ACT domain-containing protein [Ilumatobacter coccineus]BAN02387.1 hypothetical protein YM304_20730 [Ilumatobacter coccineus YM16-304]